MLRIAQTEPQQCIASHVAMTNAYEAGRRHTIESIARPRPAARAGRMRATSYVPMTEITSQLSTALAENLKHKRNHLAWLASRPQLWCRP